MGLPLPFKVKTLGEVLGISPASSYELLPSEGFLTLKIGNCLVLPKERTRRRVKQKHPQKQFYFSGRVVPPSKQTAEFGPMCEKVKARLMPHPSKEIGKRLYRDFLPFGRSSIVASYTPPAEAGLTQLPPCPPEGE